MSPNLDKLAAEHRLDELRRAADAAMRTPRSPAYTATAADRSAAISAYYTACRAFATAAREHFAAGGTA